MIEFPVPTLSGPDELTSLAAWHTRRRRVWAKIISLMVTLTFVFPYVTWAFESSSYALGQLPVVTYRSKPVTIPEQYGVIRSSHQGGQKLIVHIQDLHCNYEVQMNISNIIDHLADEHQVRVLAVEGANTPINTTKLGTFPVQDVKERVGQLLIRQGQIGGPEYYSATGKHKVALEGIENRASYRQSLALVHGFLNAESQGHCYSLREILDDLKAELYSPELLRFDEQRRDFREGEVTLAEYAALLVKRARRSKLDLKPYPNTTAYLQGEHSVFPISVDVDALYRELDQLDARLRDGLYTQDAQRQLDDIYRRVDVVEKLINISATPEEVAEFFAHRRAYAVRTAVEFIRANDPEGEFEVEPDLYQLDRYLDRVAEFYRMADQRSHEFVDNTVKSLDRHQESIAVLVSGGYHTQGVLQVLKDRGYSYVSVMPRILHQNVVNPYFALLQGRQMPLEKLLAKNQNLLAVPLKSAPVAAENVGTVLNEENAARYLAETDPETLARVTTHLSLVQFLLNSRLMESLAGRTAAAALLNAYADVKAGYRAK